MVPYDAGRLSGRRHRAIVLHQTAPSTAVAGAGDITTPAMAGGVLVFSSLHTMIREHSSGGVRSPPSPRVRPLWLRAACLPLLKRVDGRHLCLFNDSSLTCANAAFDCGDESCRTSFSRYSCVCMATVELCCAYPRLNMVTYLPRRTCSLAGNESPENIQLPTKKDTWSVTHIK